MEEIEKSLTETIETSDLNAINKDLAEIVVDSVLDDGLLRDLPIVNLVIGLGNFGSKIQKGIFLKKVLSFLSNLGSTSTEERKKFVEKIEKSETYNNKVGEALLMILDKYSDLEKTKILGKLFRVSIREEISYQQFLRISSSLDKVHIPDLQFLKKIKDGEIIDFFIKEELYRAGFMNRTTFGQVQTDGSNEYYINEYGENVIRIIFE